MPVHSSLDSYELPNRSMYNNMKIKKLCSRLHLWLGLLSGIVVFVVCVTGCLFVFNEEIRALYQPYQRVQPQEKPFLRPSQLLSSAHASAEGEVISSLTYGQTDDAVVIDFVSGKAGDRQTIYLNPYTGRVLKVKKTAKSDFDFFKFVITVHRTLWLPRSVGKAIVGYSVLIFFITLVTGVVLWWPMHWNKKTMQSKLGFHHSIQGKHLIVSLHHVPGIYFIFPLLLVSFTGMMISLGWLQTGVYQLLSYGEPMQKLVVPQSDSLAPTSSSIVQLDKLYHQVSEKYADAAQIQLQLPQSKDEVYGVKVRHVRNTRYYYDYLFFDQNSLHPLKGAGVKAGCYTELTTANATMRLNRAVHDGSIWGIWTKILMFLTSLVGACLPVTGFLIWYRRQRK